MTERTSTTLTRFIEQNKDGSLPTYPEYKDSKVDWLNQIPESWDQSRLGFNAEFIVPQRHKPSDLDGDIPWVRIEDFDGMYISESKSGRGVSKETIDKYNLRVFPKNTVLCSCSCNMGVTTIANRPMVSNQTFIGIVTKKHLEPEYVYFLMSACKDHLTALSTGAIQQYLSRDDFSQFEIPLPPLEHQKKISAFLERKIDKIDKLVEKKKNLIDLIREKEEALVTEVVTSGIDDDVTSKQADNQIIGKLPKHWEESKLGNITVKLTNGYVGPTRNILSDDGVPYIQSTHINNGEIEFDGEFFVSKEWSENHKTSKLRTGDVLLVQTGDVGESAVVREDLDGANCHALIIARPIEEVNSLYLNLFLESKIGKKLLQRTQTGATLKHLNTTRVKDVTVPVPPKEEQKNIVGCLESEREKFDSKVDLINKGIERLGEYRSALITEAVTGQIDVRSEV